MKQKLIVREPIAKSVILKGLPRKIYFNILDKLINARLTNEIRWLFTDLKDCSTPIDYYLRNYMMISETFYYTHSPFDHYCLRAADMMMRYDIPTKYCTQLTNECKFPSIANYGYILRIRTFNDVYNNLIRYRRHMTYQKHIHPLKYFRLDFFKRNSIYGCFGSPIHYDLIRSTVVQLDQVIVDIDTKEVNEDADNEV